MESDLVRRDQFSISPQGIVHKPTDAAFTPYPGDPYSGTERLGNLNNKHPNGHSFSKEQRRCAANDARALARVRHGQSRFDS